MSTVFISGASGFIAQHIVKVLIENGHKVVGSVRSAEKGKRLAANLGPAFSYEIVTDISEANSFDVAFQKHPEITAIIHCASPFTYETDDPENDLVVPAIKGTENILAAAKRFSAAKRIVITSSDAAIYSAEDEQNAGLSFDESSWNNISYEDAIVNPVFAYYGAKLFAEKIAWKFAEENPDIKLVSVNPVWVFGPQAFEAEVSDKLNASNEIINTLTKLGPSDDFEKDKGGFIDVRDVARAHLAALDDVNVIGKRLYLTNGKFSAQHILDVLHERFGLNVPLGIPGSGDKDVQTLAKTNNDTTRQLLGYEFILFEKMIVDTVQQILDYRNRS